MKTLESKIQYHNFEPGEFVEIKQRNQEETIALVEHFPWAKEREKIQIEITNPSITIENTLGEYIKIATYFRGDYCIYFYNTQNELYTKTIARPEDCKSYIQEFITEEKIKTKGFRKENIWSRNIVDHFKTKEFIYYNTNKKTGLFFLFSCLYNLLMLLIPLIFIFYTANKVTHDTSWMNGLFILLFFFLGGGVNLIYFFKYYFHSRNKVLHISKGSDIFYYGEKNKLITYNKNDIEKIIVFEVNNSRYPLSYFVVYNVVFKNNDIISIPNFNIHSSELSSKFTRSICVYKNKVKFKLN
jgi:hypothetical protein